MLNSMQDRTIVKTPQVRLVGVLLPCILLIIFALVAAWRFSQHTMATPDAQNLLPTAPTPLITSLLSQNAIVWTTTLFVLAMVSALLVAVSPLRWWMRLLALQARWRGADPEQIVAWDQEQQRTEERFAAQEAALQTEQFQAMPTVQPVGQPGIQNQPITPPAPVHGQPQQTGQQPQTQQSQVQQQPQTQQQPNSQQPQQLDGQQQQLQPQPDGQQPSQQAAPQPHTQQPQGPTALQLLQAQEEELDLEEITDIGDILSTFADTEAVPPHLLALSQSLDDVDVQTLAASTSRVAGYLMAANERRATD